MTDGAAVNAHLHMLNKHEDDIRQLTINVATLTRDVHTLVQTQQQVSEAFGSIAIQRTEIEHFRESMNRGFGRIERLETQINVLLTNQEVNAAIDRTRVSFGMLLLKYWHLILGIGALSALGGYLYGP